MSAKSRVINIEGDVIFGRIYKLYNSIDNYVYIGSTTLPLTKRLGDHVYSYNNKINMGVYNHMRKTGISNWTIKLLEGKVVENIVELRVLEQKWIDKENPKYLLNFKNATKEDKSLNEIRFQLNNIQINEGNKI
mgnify:FL=1